MKKLIGSFVLSAMLAGSVTAFADTVDFVGVKDIDNNIIKITGDLGVSDGEREIFLLFAKEGEILSANAYFDGINGNSQVITVPADGKYEYDFEFSGGGGNYYVYYTGAVKPYGPFIYISKEDVNEFIAKLGNQEISKDELFEKFSIYSSSMGIDISDINTAEKKDYIASKLYELNEEIAENGLEAIKEIISNSKNELAFFSSLSSAVSTYEVNKLITEKYAVVGINITAYNSLSETRKNNLCKKFVGAKYKDVDTFVKDFNNALNSATNDPEAPSSGGKPSGGSTGFGGGSYSPVTDETTKNTKANSDTSAFGDINDVQWAKDAIGYLYKNNIMSGVGGNSFDPDSYITREQFAKIITLAFGVYKKDLKCEFEDISESDWAYSYVASAKNSGLMNGISDSGFGTGAYITREDIAAILYRYLQSRGKTFGAKTEFADTDLISEYAMDAVKNMAGSGYISGIGENKFAPQDFATRAQAAKLIYAVIKGEQ